MADNVIATLLVKIGVQVNEIDKGFKQVEGKLKGFQGSFKNTAKQIGAVFGGQQILKGFKSVVEASNEFRLDLAKLNNSAHLSVDELNKVGNAAQSLAGKFGVSSNDIVHGLTELSKLGYDTASSLKQMPQLLKFNVATGTEFSTTIGLMETVLKDFDKELDYTGKATDIFSAAIAKGRLTANDLSDSFKKAGASGKNAGASVSDVAEATSRLAIKGFSGAEAGTALNAIFGNLTKTGGVAQRKLSEFGISVTDSAGKMKPFGQLVTEIQNKFKGLTDAQKNEAAQSIAGKEHMAKFLAVISGAPGSFEEFSASLENADGSTAKAFTGIDQTAARSIEKLNTTFDVFKQKMGQGLEPAIKSVSDALTGLLDWFNQLDPGVQEIIGYLGAAIAIFGVLAAVVGAAALAFSFLSLPILAIIAAIALLVAGFLYLWNNSDEVTAAIQSGWDALGDFLSGLWEDIKSTVSAFGQFFVDLWDSIVDGVVAAFQWLYDHNYYFKKLVDKIKEIWNSFKAFASKVWNAIVTFVVDKWNSLKNKATNIFNSIKGVVTSIWNKISSTIQGWASKAYKWGANFLQMLINGIKSKVGAIVKTVKDIGSKIASYLGFHSPTDKGPLANSDQWMPNFMNMLDRGLEMGIPKLEMAVGDVAATMDLINPSNQANSVTNTVNVYPRQANLDARGLNRELERIHFLNGGVF